MKIRKANPTDIEQLSTLFEGYREFYKRQADLAGTKEFLLTRMERNESIIYVAEDQNHLLHGFVQLYPIFSSTKLKRLWLLNDLYVRPESRGQRISVSLINECKRLAKSKPSAGLMLQTGKTNDIGNHLYPATGFVLDEEYNYYYWEI